MYIYIKGSLAWGPVGRLLSPMGVHLFLKPWFVPGSALWPTKKGYVHNVYKIKQSRGVLR